MRVIMSAAGRAALRAFLVAFLALATGIMAAPNLDQAAALAGAASVAGLIAVARSLRVFVPQIAEQLAGLFGLRAVYAEIAVTALTTLGMGFLALSLGVLSAPDLDGARAAGLAGILAIGEAIVRLAQGFLTPGETPVPQLAVKVPAQPVAPESLPVVR